MCFTDATGLHEIASSLPIQNIDCQIQCPEKLGDKSTEILSWILGAPVGTTTHVCRRQDSGTDKDALGQEEVQTSQDRGTITLDTNKLFKPKDKMVNNFNEFTQYMLVGSWFKVGNIFMGERFQDCS